MDETEIVMGKKKMPATASEKYRTELAEIEQAAKDANCDTNFCIAPRWTVMLCR